MTLAPVQFGQGVVLPPDDPRDLDRWRRLLDQWRQSTIENMGYDGSRYGEPGFTWTRSCFTCALLMLWDREFYDPASGAFMVEPYLQRGIEQFGGYDGVVLWHAYPRIGVDDRNQFDFYRQVPGGLPGLRRVVDQLHDHEVRVFIDYNPWDVGTRREQLDDAEVLAELVATLDVDGIFLDTMSEGAPLRAAVDKRRAGVIFESEGHLPLENLHDHHMSWGQWFDVAGNPPPVLRNKWIERRHMHHLVQRWDIDHSDELHAAWLNGVGVLVWENVFGTWNGWSDRDSSMLRTVVPVQRQYADLFADGTWTPLVPTKHPDVFASLWTSDGTRLWTLVNRSDTPISGDVLVVDHTPGAQYRDVFTQRTVQVDGSEPEAVLTVELPARGIGGFASVLEDQWGSDRTSRSAVTPISGASPNEVRRVGPQPSPNLPSAPDAMVAFDGTEREIGVVFRLRECGTYDPAPVLDIHYPRFHDSTEERRHVALTSFAIDQAPVTNAQFADFVRQTGYRPERDGVFLAHWEGATPRHGTGQLPVVNVDIDDARAYAHWAGKRLPTEFEWQHALESGQVGYGNGRVWEWTESVHSDAHTRFCILKGGSEYAAYGSVWYTDGGPRPPEFSLKFILSWPELDRCSTVGFRCAVDLTDRGADDHA